MIQFASLFFICFFWCSHFFELEIIQFDYWNVVKTFEAANYKGNFSFSVSHGTRHGVGLPPHACKPQIQHQWVAEYVLNMFQWWGGLA